MILNKGWFEGMPFYEFYKNGGLHNTIEVFNWLKSLLNVIDHTWQQQYIYLFDDVSSKAKEFLTSVMTLRQIDNS